MDARPSMAGMVRSHVLRSGPRSVPFGFAQYNGVRALGLLETSGLWAFCGANGTIGVETTREVLDRA
jgi:hypothetical protein